MRTVHVLSDFPMPAGELVPVRGFISRLEGVGYQLTAEPQGATVCLLVACNSALLQAAACLDPSTVIASLDPIKPDPIPDTPGHWARHRIQGHPCWIYTRGWS